MRPFALAALALAISAPALAGAQPATSLPAVETALMAPVLRVADCSKAQAFYETALDMKTLMSRDLGPIHETMLAFSGPGHQPGIMLLCNVSADRAPLKGLGASRLIVRVGDIDALARRLDAAGLPHPAIRAPGKDPVRILNLSDPEGNELELVQTGAAPARSQP